MAFFYVKSGFGTNTGAATSTTERTGAFSSMTASDTYNNVDVALNNNTMSAGDVIRCSSAHNYQLSGTNITWTMQDGVIIESVNDANCDQYLAGASEATGTVTNQTNVIFTITNAAQGYASILGMTMISSHFINHNGNNVTHHFNDCTIKTLIRGNSGRLYQASGNGTTCVYTDCSMEWDTVTGQPLFQAGDLGGTMIFDGCTFTGEITNIGQLFYCNAGYGSGTFIIRNCDLSPITNAAFTTAMFRCNLSGHLHVEFHNNKLPTGTYELFSSNVNWSGSLSGNDTADDWWEFESFGDAASGQAEIDITTYNNENVKTYDGTNEFSIQCDTNAEASVASPFVFKLLETGNDIDLATAKTITVMVNGASGLKTNEVFLRIAYTDATDNALMNIISSLPADKLDNSTGLTTTGADTWASGTTAYLISVNIPAQTGVTKGKIVVYGGCSLTSGTVNFDMPTFADT